MILTENDIYHIYREFVAVNHNDTQAKKYIPFPIHLNNKRWRWRGKDFPRVMALLEFREYMLEMDVVFDSVLSFNGANDPEYEYIRYNKMTNYNYKDNIDKYDLHCLDMDKSGFDFVMLNQTIEHLYDPILALKNIYKYIKTGGFLYANVPVNNVLHDTPFHYYTGVTPVGLGVIMKMAGFDILKIGQWGNKAYFKQMFDHKWADYYHMCSLTDDPGYNDFDCPIITWCLAKKA